MVSKQSKSLDVAPSLHTLKWHSERTGPPTLWYLGNVDGPQYHAETSIPDNLNLGGGRDWRAANADRSTS